ncbi:MAG: glycosyltransferase family 4 protein [Gammaproteobacteria bacterium]|nr:glycosyltransferase family 4 protein [Gammaproteobacteria bacterium]
MSQDLVIVQRRLTHYRVPFFLSLQGALDAVGLRLRLVVGDPTDGERSKQDEGAIEWAEHVACHYLLGGKLCWQSLGPPLVGATFVVLTQENRLLANWWQLLGRHPYRVGLWGHGADLQSCDLKGPAHRWKRFLATRADWCFAYTELSASLMQQDVPHERVTVLNNAIDTHELRTNVVKARSRSLPRLRQELGLGDGPVAIFVGSLYGGKRFDLLLEAAATIHARCPDFELMVAGAGPLAGWLQEQIAALPWVRYLGPIRGEEKARWLAAADVLLNPGSVGLGILDSFSSGVPMITTSCGNHGPEIAFLEHDRNGLMVAPTAGAIAEATLRLLEDPSLADRLRTGCDEASRTYTLDAMVERFVEGAVKWRASLPRIHVHR